MARLSHALAAPLLLAALVLGGCATTAHERPNLGVYKQELRHYVESGAYDREIASLASRARTWIEERAAARTTGQRLTVIFDLDETMISSLPYMLEHDFGWTTPSWKAWVHDAQAPAIIPVRDVYHRARQSGVDVIFLTARHEDEREATERNLRALGCSDYAALICQPVGSKTSSALFKAAERARLTAEGRVIIAMIGDQESDLAGGFAERTFKVPNPFYIVP